MLHNFTLQTGFFFSYFKNYIAILKKKNTDIDCSYWIKFLSLCMHQTFLFQSSKFVIEHKSKPFEKKVWESESTDLVGVRFG